MCVARAEKSGWSAPGVPFGPNPGVVDLLTGNSDARGVKAADNGDAVMVLLDSRGGVFELAALATPGRPKSSGKASMPSEKSCSRSGLLRSPSAGSNTLSTLLLISMGASISSRAAVVMSNRRRLLPGCSTSWVRRRWFGSVSGSKSKSSRSTSTRSKYGTRSALLRLVASAGFSLTMRWCLL